MGHPDGAVQVLIVAGEASGDLHAANLVDALRRRVDELHVFGIGGERLRAAGIDCIARSEELSVMGFAEVALELPRLATLARRIRVEGIARGPDVAVLVDSPDFNLPLARHLRRAGVPVVVYVSPQLWAWRSGRVRKVRRNVSRVLCILPFEVEFYRRHGVDVEYVGHPLMDELGDFERYRTGPEEDTVALLPGSRWHEVDSLLAPMLAACREVRRDRPGLRVKLVAAPGLSVDRLQGLAAGAGLPVELVVADRHQAIASSAAALVASGTATLECAVLGVPMAVCYRLHALSYLAARLLVRVPFVSLANLVAGEGVVPELIQRQLTPEALAATLRGLLGGEGERQRRDLAKVRALLGGPGASERAASAVIDVAGQRAAARA
jgi:lipid-A-disaccharide synthase